MNASVIRCPGCGAADTSLATPAGVHTCVYCGVRYQISAGRPNPMPVAAAPRSVNVARLVAASALLAALLTGVVLYVASTKPPAKADPVRAAATRAIADRLALADPVHNPSVSVEAAAEDTTPATAEFTLETVRTTGKTSLWIYGYFHNTSPFTLGNTKITAVFYDKDGAEIFQDSAYTEDDVIASDARVATVIFVSDAPAVYERIAFEVAPKRPTYLPGEVEGLELEADPPRRDSFLGWKYAGKVHNKSGQPAKFVKVRVLAFDDHDKFAGHAYTFASADALADGATARFDGTLLDSAPFKRFEFQVSGRPAQ